MRSWGGMSAEASLSFLCSNISRSEFFTKKRMNTIGISRAAWIKIASRQLKATVHVLIMIAVVIYPNIMPNINPP